MLCPPRQIVLSACAILTCLVLNREVVSSFPQPSIGTQKRWERIPVLQYHDEWVCVNKPPGLTVHRSKGTPKSRPVLTTTLKRQLSRKIFPIHRLDHRTSGAMLLTFNSDMAATLHDQAIRKGSKKYLALVRGFWTFDKEIVIDKPLTIKNVTREARTKFTCIATMDGEYDRSSLVLCEPLTGKTHQIRRHACSIGHPIIGDTEHGDTKINRWWRQERGLDRLALHCWILDFTLDGKAHQCVAPLQYSFRGAIESTSLWEPAVASLPLLSKEPHDERGGSFGRDYKPQSD